MPAPQYPQVELATSFKNPATRRRGRRLHARSTRGSSTATSRRTARPGCPSDVNQYGFTRWNPPDAGANQDIPEEGGGIYDNDGRFMNSQGTPEAGTEGALQYLGSAAAQSQPFFMVVSLVNPHDVLFYPKTYASARLRRLVAAGRDRAAGDGERGPLDQADACRRSSCKIFNALRPDPDGRR